MLNLNRSALLKTMKNKINSCGCKQNIGKNIKSHYHKCNNVNGYSNYMQIAIDVAERQLIKQPHTDHEHEIPIGCVIVDNKTGKILAKSCNKTIKSNNSLQHAEIICINRALKKLSTNRLTNCSMYITLEPCIMCAGAIMLSKIDRLYIGCLSQKPVPSSAIYIYFKEIYATTFQMYITALWNKNARHYYEDFLEI